MKSPPASSCLGVTTFRRWMRAQDAGRLLASLRVRSVAGFLLRGSALVGATAWAPGVHAFFAVPLTPALACFLPCAVHRVAFAFVHARRGRVAAWGWLTWLPGLALEHFFLATLTALAALPGAFLLGVLLIGTSAVHGRRYRVTWREPFLMVGTLGALLGAAALGWHAPNGRLLTLVGPAAVVAQLYVGSLAVRYDQARADADRLRAAVHAQLVEQQERDVGRLTQAMAEILGHHQGMDQALHEAGTAADMLKAFGTQRGGLARSGFDDQARQLQDSLRQLQEMVREVRAKSRRFAGTDPEAVDLGGVLESVQAQVSLRFPDVDIHVELEPPRPPRALVRGGPLTLRRVVENLVVNACEGNGEQGASRVFIRARTEPLSGRLEVVIEDDGPGFPPERLNAPAEELYTTKSQGTGLGLYTSECLLRASGGLLHRHNGPGGGALLRILLPREYP
ncbi:sensor histidine kinase [Corallococcus interemptor]|uniref:histidine kinase n=1 Tax=Corallococcus interemptor TaxID=2316720 RepID=A0A3A8QDX3_9BACT|nr:HAMP domain-containing sensor histidine kinase [Corallococcus interemptor]RKH49441.1 sensor histidine kinase [Corallococcus sp. AB050B]RKH63022.1 sensor histidine kinase [Corallococcus interemptor]